MVCRLGRYQYIVNGANRGGRGNSNACENQQNQRKNVMFLQQDSNGVNYNIFPTEDQLEPVKDGSNCSLE